MYYIISLLHTNKHDKYITLWRPNNAGYCQTRESAGLYDTIEKGYHDSEPNMPISDIDAERLFIELNYNGELKHVIPNCKAIWDDIGVKMTQNGLKKIK